MQEIINRISAEMDINPDLVEKAVRAQFEFVKEIMEIGDMRSVQLQYLGKFAVKPKRLEFLKSKLESNPVE